MAQYGQACRPGPGRLHRAIFQPEQHGSGWRTHMTMLCKILAITLPRFGNRSCKPPHRCLISQAQIDRVDGNVAVAHGVSQSNDELRDRLEAMSALQRSVFLAYTFDRMTDEEVARYHGISRRAARRALYQAVSIIDRSTVPELRS